MWLIWFCFEFYLILTHSCIQFKFIFEWNKHSTYLKTSNTSFVTSFMLSDFFSAQCLYQVKSLTIYLISSILTALQYGRVFLMLIAIEVFLRSYYELCILNVLHTFYFVNLININKIISKTIFCEVCKISMTILLLQ